MDIGNDRYIEAGPDLGKHPESLVDTRAPERRQRCPVRLVKRALENKWDVQVGADLFETFGGLKKDVPMFDDTGSCDEKELPGTDTLRTY
jgi:hypothetical protein